MVGAKAQPTNTLLPLIQERSNISIRSGASVRRVIYGTAGSGKRALGVTYLDDKGEEVFQPAELVFLASWTLNNTRLLLLSGIGESLTTRAMGAKEVSSFPGLKNYDANRYRFTHIQGGTITGNSPDRSVVNPYLQHWQVPNLFVLGASTIPQNPSAHPTLTILALAYRTADAIVNRYLKSPSQLA